MPHNTHPPKTDELGTPSDRITSLNTRPPDPDGKYVLYWMTAFRRPQFNYALQLAVEWSNQLNKPLLIFEGLQANYRWSSRRFHQFIVDGMKNNASAAQLADTAYYPYVEPAPGDGKGLIRDLATEACLVVTDDYPCFFLPALKRYAQGLSTCSLAVDSNGILPLSASPKIYTTAYSFRRFLQKTLPPHLTTRPLETPLEHLRYHNRLDDLVCDKTLQRHPPLLTTALDSILESIPFEADVPATSVIGGCDEAQRSLATFLDTRLESYGERNHPDNDVQSHLSPYLHFGHISAHAILHQLLDRYGWEPEQLSDQATGSRQGWWNLPPETEGFLDQLITWRELGFNMCSQNPLYDRYESLPNWARVTLQKHSTDPRPVVYSLEELEHSLTEDELWNACQRQLVQDGFIHNYLRMLWGKKIFQWTHEPQAALEIMIHLNNKYALDGRDPNSYSGIFWTLGRYDRAWGPERDIFGKIRYMTSDSARKKLRVKKYIERDQAGGTEELP